MELKTAKGRLFFLVLMIILLPILQNTFRLTVSKDLDGAMLSHPDPQISLATWWDGTYQEKKTSYINDSVGFRTDLVRMTNQLNFWIFRTLPEGTYVGKDGYLFLKDYVDEYEGRTYQPAYDSAICATLQKLKMVQDTLDRLGKTFIFVYAPSKPYFMPENIPLCLRRSGGPQKSNYAAFRKFADSLKIRQLDFNALFIAMKDTSKGPLYCKQGVHWSLYGSLLAADTMIKFIERERNINMPHLVITKLCFPDTIIFPDNDIAKSCNLIFPMDNGKLCYPEYHYDTDGAKTKPKIIFIGDSYGGQWLGNEFPQSVSNRWEFWFYFKTVWDQQHLLVNGINIDGYNWQKAMLDADCMVSVFTATNLQGMTIETAYIEKMYNYFYPGKKQ